MASFTVNGDNTTVTFVYTAGTDKISSIVGDVAHSLFDENHLEGEFSSLSNQEKLDLVDDYIKEMILERSNIQKKKDLVDSAVDTALSGYESYTL